MPIVKRHALVSLVLALALVLWSAPAEASRKPPPEPDYLDPSFSSEQVGRIAVLPVADLRIDKSIPLVKKDQVMQRVVRQMLRKSPYEIAFGPAWTSPDAVTRDDLEDLEASWVGGLGKAEDRWVLLIALEDLTKKRTFGSAFGVVCTGYLFDKQAGREVWRHETVGSMGHGGLSGLAMSGTARIQAFELCVGNLLVTFPDRKGRLTAKR